jgi:hypothetical protein
VVRQSRGTSTRGDAASAFGPELPSSGLVPPLPFFPASTVFSAWYLAGLLRPAADHGVRHVSGRSPCVSSGSLRSLRPPGRLRFPRGHLGRPCRIRAFPVAPRGYRSGLVWHGRAPGWTFPGGAIPFGAFPSTAAVSRHRDHCPLAVGPAWSGLPSHFHEGRAHPSIRPPFVDLRALLRWRVRCGVARCRHVAARCSHGLRSHARVGLPLRPPALPALRYRSASGLAAEAWPHRPGRDRVAPTSQEALPPGEAIALRGARWPDCLHVGPGDAEPTDPTRYRFPREELPACSPRRNRTWAASAPRPAVCRGRLVPRPVLLRSARTLQSRDYVVLAGRSSRSPLDLPGADRVSGRPSGAGGPASVEPARSRSTTSVDFAAEASMMSSSARSCLRRWRAVVGSPGPDPAGAFTCPDLPAAATCHRCWAGRRGASVQRPPARCPQCGAGAVSFRAEVLATRPGGRVGLDDRLLRQPGTGLPGNPGRLYRCPRFWRRIAVFASGAENRAVSRMLGVA